MLKELSIDDSDSKREVPVMTRLDNKVIRLLDMLIKLNIFKSRSEAVAAIVEKTLLTQQDKFDLLQEQLSKLEEIEDTAKGIALDVMKG
jgi:Arc/MetJ-type ribon-helix-helix transcriptional regulator